MLEKRYDPQQAEQQMQQLWEEEQVYRFDPQDSRPVYAIDTPPPTVSGSLHIGHIYSYTQAEIIARFRRMQNFNVFYPFGFDDNGLPTERLVEKELGKRAGDIPRKQLAQSCGEVTKRYVAQFEALWRSLGFSADWSQKYETISPMVQRISQRSFLAMARAGRAYQKQSPVLWCPQCRTSIAQAELESREQEAFFYYLPFVSNQAQIPVATTRPELLYGCVALFVSPSDPRYSHLIGAQVQVPLYGFAIPVLADDRVEKEKGTGAVMCATYGDGADVAWCEDYHLPYKKMITSDGRLEAGVPDIGGLPVEQGRKKIAALLEEKGLLLKAEPIRHAVAVHERCGHAVEIIPSRQWYIDVLSQKEKLLEAAEQIRWYPPQMKKRYKAWVQNLRWDWCISRQRYFGVPLPVWYCQACGRPIFASEEQLPADPVKDRPPVKACLCGCCSFLPERAVMDTWATSSLTPQINARAGEPGDRSGKILPMGLRTQAHEIIRTWTFYTIAKSLFHTGQAPWKDIMISGFVMAKKGEKISKSKNNGQPVQQLVRQYSADVLRLWAAGAGLGADTYFAPQELGAHKRFITKLYNAARFVLAQLEDEIPAPPPMLLPTDPWILQLATQTTEKAAQFLYCYETGAARREIDAFFWRDFCDTYLELCKGRLYEPKRYGEEGRRSAQYTLYQVLFRILQLYAPFVPHITEWIYQQYYRRHYQTVSLHQTQWPCSSTTAVTEDRLLRFGDEVKAVLSKVRQEKAQKNLSIKEPIECLEIETQAELLPLFQDSCADLASCCHAESIAFIVKKD